MARPSLIGGLASLFYEGGDIVIALYDSHIKKQTTIGRLFCNIALKAEGTGFEPADTLRYRQFSKLLV